jgi:hypothetical protein
MYKMYREEENCTECQKQKFKEGGEKWMQKLKLSKDKPCTGNKFGGPTCPPGSKQYNLAKVFNELAAKRKKEMGGQAPMNQAKDIGQQNIDYFAGALKSYATDYTQQQAINNAAQEEAMYATGGNTKLNIFGQSETNTDPTIAAWQNKLGTLDKNKFNFGQFATNAAINFDNNSAQADYNNAFYGPQSNSTTKTKLNKKQIKADMNSDDLDLANQATEFYDDFKDVRKNNRKASRQIFFDKLNPFKPNPENPYSPNNQFIQQYGGNINNEDMNYFNVGGSTSQNQLANTLLQESGMSKEQLISKAQNDPGWWDSFVSGFTSAFGVTPEQVQEGLTAVAAIGTYPERAIYNTITGEPGSTNVTSFGTTTPPQNFRFEGGNTGMTEEQFMRSQGQQRYGGTAPDLKAFEHGGPHFDTIPSSSYTPIPMPGNDQGYTFQDFPTDPNLIQASPYYNYELPPMAIDETGGIGSSMSASGFVPGGYNPITGGAEDYTIPSLLPMVQQQRAQDVIDKEKAVQDRIKAQQEEAERQRQEAEKEKNNTNNTNKTDNSYKDALAKDSKLNDHITNRNKYEKGTPEYNHYQNLVNSAYGKPSNLDESGYDPNKEGVENTENLLNNSGNTNQEVTTTDNGPRGNVVNDGTQGGGVNTTTTTNTTGQNNIYTPGPQIGYAGVPVMQGNNLMPGYKMKNHYAPGGYGLAPVAYNADQTVLRDYKNVNKAGGLRGALFGNKSKTRMKFDHRMNNPNAPTAAETAVDNTVDNTGAPEGTTVQVNPVTGEESSLAPGMTFDANGNVIKANPSEKVDVAENGDATPESAIDGTEDNQGNPDGTGPAPIVTTNEGTVNGPITEEEFNAQSNNPLGPVVSEQDEADLLEQGIVADRVEKDNQPVIEQVDEIVEEQNNPNVNGNNQNILSQNSGSGMASTANDPTDDDLNSMMYEDEYTEDIDPSTGMPIENNASSNAPKGSYDWYNETTGDDQNATSAPAPAAAAPDPNLSVGQQKGDPMGEMTNEEYMNQVAPKRHGGSVLRRKMTGYTYGQGGAYKKPVYEQGGDIGLSDLHNELKMLEARKAEIQGIVSNTQFNNGQAQLPTASGGYEVKSGRLQKYVTGGEPEVPMYEAPEPDPGMGNWLTTTEKTVEKDEGAYSNERMGDAASLIQTGIYGLTNNLANAKERQEIENTLVEKSVNAGAEPIAATQGKWGVNNRQFDAKAQEYPTQFKAYTSAQYGGQFKEGGEYYLSEEEIAAIRAMGGEIEYLD